MILVRLLAAKDDEENERENLIRMFQKKKNNSGCINELTIVLAPGYLMDRACMSRFKRFRCVGNLSSAGPRALGLAAGPVTRADTPAGCGNCPSTLTIIRVKIGCPVLAAACSIVRLHERPS